MDLSCGEKLASSAQARERLSGADRCSAGPDRALDSDPRLIHNLMLLERTHALNVDYFQHVQSDLEPYMRKIVATWMLEVCEEQRCEEQVFPLAVSYMDRFLALRPVSRKQLQLLAVTAMLLASKFRQCHPLGVDILCAYTVCEEQRCEEQVFPLAVSYMDRFLALRPVSRKQLQLLAVTAMLLASKFRQCHPLGVDILCAYTDHSVEPDQVRQWEVMLLQCLNWQMSVVTAFDFVEPLLARVPWGRTNPLVRSHAHTLISVCYSECAFMLVPASLVALACVSAAARGLRVRGAGVAQLCALTRTPPAAAELLARHVERVVSEETRPPAPRTPDDKRQPYSQPTTPTDVQDIDF